MMTLEEAIKHCKDVALSCTNKECALEHFQLLKWLQEYSNMLEKQGEHANFRNKIKIGDKVTRNEDGVLVNLSQLKRVAKKEEKQSEQKSYASETMNEKENFDSSFTRMMEKEQKYAWSEEDEKMLECAIDMIEWYSVVNKSKSKLVSDWLKSLRPQSRWKESLATADLENSLCDIQDGFSDTSYEYRILGEAIEFIRCTEPKPQWKPSDEQMDALRYVTNFDYGGYKAALVSLYEQLKKLREE